MGVSDGEGATRRATRKQKEGGGAGGQQRARNGLKWPSPRLGLGCQSVVVFVIVDCLRIGTGIAVSTRCMWLGAVADRDGEHWVVRGSGRRVPSALLGLRCKWAGAVSRSGHSIVCMLLFMIFIFCDPDLGPILPLSFISNCSCISASNDGACSGSANDVKQSSTTNTVASLPSR